MKKFSNLILSVLMLILVNSCAYYNLFFNAEKNYESGQKANRRISADEELSADEKRFYNASITKSWKLINIYSDSNKYSDDALLLIGKSHYNLQEYDRAEDIFKKFLQKYTKSNLQTEAQLWMAKTYIQRKKDDDAIEMLNKLITNDKIGNFAAEAYYNLGELYFLREQDEEAIKYLELSLSNNPGNKLAGQSILQLAEAFFRSGQYEKATKFIEKIKRYEVGPILEYRVLMIHVSSLMKLGQPDEARIQLLKMRSDVRFKEQHSLIASKLAEFPALQADYRFALEEHKDVLKKYNKTAGAAFSAYEIGNIYHYDFVNFDSAAFYYALVEKMDSRSEKRNEAQSKKKLLDDYLKIRNQIYKDIKDLNSLHHGDSTLIDSVEVETDSALFIDPLTELTEEENTEERNENLLPENPDSTKYTDAGEEQNRSIAERRNAPGQIREQKKAVTRDPASVELSLFKNRYALGEYFLLELQNGDSAYTAFNRFIQFYPQDTLMQAKAWYSMYYTCQVLLNDSIKADSISGILFQKYPGSLYSEYLRDPHYLQKSEVREKAHELYLNAEKELWAKKYFDAIHQFSWIAQSDSGTIWAQKSRLSIAYIYEEHLKDIAKAVESYTLLAAEYPGTEFARLAKFKISKPIEVDDTQVEDDDKNTDSGNPNFNEDALDQPEKEVKETDLQDTARDKAKNIDRTAE